MVDIARSRSFGSVAENYHRYRFAPPAAILDWAVPADAHTVLDLAAGTGKLTAQLLQRVSSVIAVEPDPDMRAVLVSAAIGATVLEGTAEAIPVADGAVDAVFVSAAWHWFDPERAVPEIARVLRPGGRFCVLGTNIDFEVDWVGALVHREPSEQERPHRGRFVLPPGAPFTAPEDSTIHYSVEMAVSDLMGLLGTYSNMIILDEQTRQQALARAADVLADRPETRGKQLLTVPVRSSGARCTRL